MNTPTMLMISARALGQRQYLQARIATKQMAGAHGRYFSNIRDGRVPTEQQTNQGEHEQVDVLIVGGGAVGATVARLIQERSPSCTVGLIDRLPAPNTRTLSAPNKPSSTETTTPHARAYALSPRSLDLIGPSALQKLKLGRYETMQVWEQDSPATLLFSKDDLPPGAFTTSSDLLGAVVEDASLVRTLWEEIQPNAKTWAPATIQSIKNHPSGVRVGIQQEDTKNNGDDDHQHDETSTKKNTTIDARLLVAADGANSFVRNTLNMPWEGWDYGRKAVTFVVSLSHPMPPRAFQRFLPYGPVALLPTWSANHATIVWSTTPSHADKLQSMTEEELLQEINSTLHQGPSRSPPLVSDQMHASLPNPVSSALGGMERLVETLNYGLTMSHWTEMDTTFMAPPSASSIVGPRFAFPLSCRQAPNYVGERVALVGDAAHTVHPMAGQGLNLGLLDADVLTDKIRKATESGMDLGHSMFLEEYQSHRKQHVGMALAGIHTLHEMFGVRNAPFMTVKSLGMNFVHHAGPLRRQLAAVAAGAL